MSIALSALTTGYTSALISMEYDRNKPRRKAQPLFYGFVPNDHRSRERVFFLMMTMSTLHTLSKSIGCAVLVAIPGKRLAAYFLGGEMLLFFAFKIARNDFHYWTRVGGAAGVLISVLTRTFAKIVVDFTGCLQFRHAYELGGAFFSASLLWVSETRENFDLRRAMICHT